MSSAAVPRVGAGRRPNRFSEPSSSRHSAGRSRIEPDRLVGVGDHAVVIALVVVAFPAVVIDLAMVRIEPDRLVEVGGRPVAIALAVVDRAAVVVSVSIFRIEREYN